MEAAMSRHIVEVVHLPTEPGKAPVFFLKSRRAGDPLQCQRLIPLDVDQLEPLIRSIEAASKSARAQLVEHRRAGLALVPANG
jgi:hypothetical protein